MGSRQSKIFDGVESVKIRGNGTKYIERVAKEFSVIDFSKNRWTGVKWFEKNFPDVSKKGEMIVHLKKDEVKIQKKTTTFYFIFYDSKSGKLYSRNIPLTPM